MGGDAQIEFENVPTKQWVYKEKLPNLQKALVVEVGAPVTFAVETNAQGMPQAKDIAMGKGGKGKEKYGKGKGKGKTGKGKGKGGSKNEKEGEATAEKEDVGEKKVEEEANSS